jgi:hypothetical protein
MDREKVVNAFDAFVDERYGDSEEILRTQLKQAVNDHLKTKLQLTKDPIQSVKSDDTGDKKE